MPFRSRYPKPYSMLIQGQKNYTAGWSHFFNHNLPLDLPLDLPHNLPLELNQSYIISPMCGSMMIKCATCDHHRNIAQKILGLCRREKLQLWMRHVRAFLPRLPAIIIERLRSHVAVKMLLCFPQRGESACAVLRRVMCAKQKCKFTHACHVNCGSSLVANYTYNEWNSVVAHIYCRKNKFLYR